MTISRDQAVLFGSSPKCDIVLSGPGVLPFHGRLRWKSTRFKVDTVKPFDSRSALASPSDLPISLGSVTFCAPLDT